MHYGNPYEGHNTVTQAGVTKFVGKPRDSTYGNTQLPSIAASPEAEAFARASGNFRYNVPSITPPPPPVKPKVPATGNSGGGSGSGGGGTQGMTATEALAQAKFNYEKEQNENKASGLSKYYTGGSYNSGFDNLLKMIEAQGAISNKNVTDAYGRATTNINEGYGVASGLGDTGFNALNAYLQANPNNPYAGMTAQVGSAPDALTNYLSAYGVSDAPVRGQIQADQLQAQQGAGNFQNLIDVLSGVAQQGASSRGAESEMAQLLFNTSLGQDRAGYTGQANNAQAAALAQLQQQMYGDRFGVEQNRNTLAQQLAQTVAELTGNAPTGPVKEKETNNPPTGFAREIDAAYAPKEAAYNRPAQTNEQIAALRAAQEAARQNEIRQQLAAVRGGRGNLMDMF